MPSEWAADNRYLPQGVSNYPGQINHDIAPHMIEIQDCFHPDSGIKSVSVMKSTQSLATTTIENVIGWAIRHKLHNILYIISSKGMAKMRSSAAIDVLIDYSGLQDCIKPISSRMKRKTADNTFYKELSGGYRLMMTSYNSIADAKSFSWDLIIFDEIDEAPYELKGQGDPEKLFEVRGITARHLKMAKISTPTTSQGRINRNFLDGDQRYFYCRCPHCGEFQVLEMMTEGRDYGLTFSHERIDRIDVVVKDSVGYICKDCKAMIYEYQKQDMLASGKWIPTARAINPEYRSYHISNLMSPIMFYTWPRVCQDFVETGFGQNITKLKAFIINILGEPWESRAEKKSWEQLKEQSEDYKLETIPAGGLMVLGGADIQKNRIEFQAVAYGADLESWVIDYRYFYGETARRDAPVWNDFVRFLQTQKYKFKNISIPITLTAVDSGYNPDDIISDDKTNNTTEHTVYEVIARNMAGARMIACRGNPKLKDMIIKEERVKKRSALKRRYDVAINELKDEIFMKIDFPRGSKGEIHFSKDLSDEYFKGFVSEVFSEIEPGKWGYKKVYDRNEPLDTYILTRAAAERVNIPIWTTEHWNSYERKILGIT
jgi:phage terminase large subunit GpA-like protein